MSEALVIPPNFHFLKTLCNFFLDLHSLTDEKILNVYLIFPNKRSCLFFKYYLQEKADFFSAGFFPRIFSWEEFIDYLYINLFEDPFPKVSEIYKIFCFLEAVNELETIRKEEFEKYFEWGFKFIEVFEEFEKEGRIPQNLLYPPEELPFFAKKIFEDLKRFYLKYQQVLKKHGFSYSTYRLKEVVQFLKELRQKSQSLPEILKEIEEIWFIGFAALRRIEEELLNFIKDLVPNTYFIFEGWEPLPEVLKNTFKALNLKPRFISSEHKEINIIHPKISFYKAGDVHLEISEVVKLIEKPVKRPDEICIVVNDPDLVVPLLFQLENINLSLEINISLFYPIDRLLINKLFLSIIQAQKGKKENLYLVSDYIRVLTHPYVKKIKYLFSFHIPKIVKEVEEYLQRKGYLMISLEEIEREFPYYEGFLKVFHDTFFRNLENITTFFEVSQVIKNLIILLKPLWEENLSTQISWENIVLRNYLETLETKVLTFFEEIRFGSLFQDKDLILKVLEYFLKTEKISLFGDPLKGLQILGFLETRLLSFEKIVVLDVNEGVLPPPQEFNPLLTEEIKRWFGIPIYRNELWFYYFERLIKSSKEAHLLYLVVEKSKTQEFREPSRFILKLKWDLERENSPIQEKILQRKMVVFSKKEGIPKDEKVKQYLLKYLKTESVSRYFLETYLKCGAMFYFRYILKLKEPPKEGFKIEEIGNFLHEFFEKFYEKLLGKEYKISDIYEEQKLKEIFENLWKKYEFEKKMDPLSHLFSKKVAMESIVKYFEYLKDIETKVQQNILIGLEKEFLFRDNVKLNDEKFQITFNGRFDFLIKRKEHHIKYLILDFKSNPAYTPYSKKAMEFIEFINSNNLIEDFSLKTLNEMVDKLGKDLCNFQLMFYYYLFYKNKEKFIEPDLDFYIINAGFITPSDIKKPEKFLFNPSKPRDWAKIYNFFENKFIIFLEWLINHILFSDKFYFTENTELCKYCCYYIPCKNMMHIL